MVKFILANFLQHNRSKILEEWLRRMHAEISDQYALRPREELFKNIEEGFDAFFHVLIHGDFSYINRAIEKITQMRLESGFLLSDVQKVFELYRSIVISLLVKETTITTIGDFCDNITKINHCLAYSIHRFSDHFQDMHERMVLEDTRRLEEAHRLAELGKMVSRIAHELRNPLTTIGGFSRRLYKKTPEDDPDKEYLAIVVEAVNILEENVSKIIKIENEE